MSDEPTLHLSGWGLASKHGFNDGDVVYDFLDQLFELYLIDTPRANLEDHEVLKRLVREYLLPVLPYEIELYEVATNHNPIRASRVGDLTDVNDFYYELEDYYVEVPWRDVVRLAGLEVVQGAVIRKEIE